jgi:hypothetical protein
MYIYGQLQKATAEILSADPTAGTLARFWWNSTSTKLMLDDGTNNRALLRNDQACVFGSSGTAANNIRLQRGANSVLQFVAGNDVTAEGSLSTALAQISAKQEGYATASKPAFGNGGRIAWNTDTLVLSVDNGAAWKDIVDVSTAQTLTNKTLTAPAIDTILYTDQGSDPSAPAAGKTILYTKGAHVYKISNGGAATQLQEVGVTPGVSVRSVTTTDSSTTSDDILVLSGASFVETIYTAVGNTGKVLTLMHKGNFGQAYTLSTSSAIIGSNGSVTSGNYILSTPGEVLKIASNGANWLVIDHLTNSGWSATETLVVTATSAYVFTVTAANATQAAIYSNNGFTYQVSTTIAGTTTLTCSGTGTPAASGTLTKVSGTGDATITFSSRTITGVPGKATITEDTIQWRRLGNIAEIYYRFDQTGSGSAGVGDYIATLPAGLVADTSIIGLYTGSTLQDITPTPSQAQLDGAGKIAVSTNILRPLHFYLYSTTQFRVAGLNGVSANSVWSSGQYPFTAALGIAFSIRVPILGWQP